MKKLFPLLLLMLAAGSNLSYSQYVITKENNLMRNGDKIVKQQVGYVDPGKSGDNKIWDFSDLTTVNEKYKLQYRSFNDSLLTGTEHRTIYKYLLRKDTLFMTGHENPLTILTDSVPQVLLSYPFSYGSKIEKDFKFYGKYSGADSLISIGHSKVHADAYGTVMLPDADTLSNVIRVYTLNNSRIRLWNPHNSERGDMNAADTVCTDTLTRHKEEIYRWYAEGYRYPVFETVTHTYFKNDKPLSRFCTAFYYPPREQQLGVADSINSKVRERLIKNHTNDSRNSIRNRNDKNASEKGLDNGNVHHNGEFTVNAGNGNITVDYTLTENSNVEIILTDLHGRVFGYVPQHMQTGGSYAEPITRNSLFPGDYLLCFIVNGNPVSYKFNIK